jgi:hypothetical protein
MKKYHVKNPLIKDLTKNFFIITDPDLRAIEQRAQAEWGDYQELVITHLDKMSLPLFTLLQPVNNTYEYKN